MIYGILLGIEAALVLSMGLASRKLLSSHQLPVEAWADGTGWFHLTCSLIGAIAFAACVRLFGGYKTDTAEFLSRSLARMLTGGAIASLLLAGLVYLEQFNSWSQWSWFWTWVATSTAALVGVRIAHYVLMQRWTRMGTFTRHVALFGVGALGQQLLGKYFDEPEPNVKIVGVFDDRATRSPDYCCGYKVDGDIRDLAEFVRDNRVDEVVVALPLGAEGRLGAIFSQLRELPVEVSVTAPLCGVDGEPCLLEQRGSIPVVKVMQPPLTDWKLIGKELEDRILGTMILVLISPLLAAIAVLIKLDSPGPVLFRQLRYGYNNRMIEVLKFRTMRHDLTDHDAERLTTKDDPRVTKLGAFLRRTSLDELPQFINVVRGEMSIVGPRPHARAAKAGGLLYHDAVMEYAVRHKMKPGITGLAQVSGWRGETRTVEQIRRRVEHDIAYINNWSLMTDMKIIVLTVFTGFGGRNAY